MPLNNLLSQKDLILEYLKSGQSITPLLALEKFGCFRLGARIWELKDHGYNIQMTMVRNNEKHFASYKLIQEEKQLVIPI